MNVREIERRANMLLGRLPKRPYAGTAGQVRAALNRVYARVMAATGAAHTKVGLKAISGQAVYEMPSSITLPFRVTFDGIPLDFDSSYRLDHTDTDWRTTIESRPRVYMIDREGGNRLRLWPAPAQNGVGAAFDGGVGKVLDIEGGCEFLFDADVGRITGMDSTESGFKFSSDVGHVVGIDYDTNDIEVWGLLVPLELADAEDVPVLPEWSHQALVYSLVAELMRSATELRNETLAEVYDDMANDTWGRMARRLSCPEADEILVVGRRGKTSRRYEQDIVIPPAGS